MLRLALCLILLSGVAVPARAEHSKLDPRARRGLAMVRAGLPEQALKRRNIMVNQARELQVFITGDVTRAELEAAGAHVRTALPGVFTASIPEQAIDRVSALAGVRAIRGAGTVKPNLNQSVPTTGANFLRGAAPGFDGLNGAGVIVGDVDTGVDYDHGDFKNEDGTTRLLNIWDQTDAGGPNPSGFAYGSEWAPADINAHTAREIDDDGHGTHVLSIEGGDGSQTGGAVAPFTYAGMAPRADLMMVKTTFQDVDIVDGVSYIMNRATALGKNAVVNLSLGSLYGPKDGTSPFDAAISALTGPGHIVVVAAGNDGNTPVHAEVVALSGGTGTVTMNVGSTQAGAYVWIDGYYPAANNLNVRVTSPLGTAITVPVGGANGAYPGPLTTAGNVYLENGLFTAANGDKEVYFEVNVPDPNGTGANPTGTWTFEFVQPAAGGGDDETTENHTGAQWAAAAAATPGTVAPLFNDDHLLISEVGWRGLNSASLTDSTEFIEIYNPTANAIDLSSYYLSDVNGYAALPVSGTVNLAGNTTDFALKFPNGASIPAHGVKVIAADGGRYKRGTGVDADFMMFNAGGATTAQLMVDKGQHTGTYPAFGLFTNGGEFVWLFTWDGNADLVCDVDFVYWGSGTGGNVPALKTAAMCQDGPDAGTATSCYVADAGNPAGSLGRALTVPSSGSGTRQRVAAEGAENSGGNSCGAPVGPLDPPAEVDLWIFGTSETAGFVTGADPTHELVAEPGTAVDVITVAAWTTKTSWTDCGNRNVSYVSAPAIGEIADFSSQGPTRDGRQKPDIAAPGYGVGAALSHDFAITCPATPDRYLNDNSQHWVIEGTSMAAPHVSGAAAMLLQKYGAMTPAQIKTFLSSRAVTDGFTGAVWNNEWGNGKLFLGDLTDPVTQVTSPNGGEQLVVGNSAPLTWNASDAYQGVTGVDLEVSRDGGAMWETIATNQPNTGSYNWTATGPGTSHALLRVTARDAASNAGVDVSDAEFGITEPAGVSADVIADYDLGILGSQPSHGAADVEFAVPRASQVRVEAFDVLGRSAGVLASGAHGVGRYRVHFTGGSRQHAGVFFVRLSAPGRSIVKRLVMVQ